MQPAQPTQPTPPAQPTQPVTKTSAKLLGMPAEVRNNIYDQLSNEVTTVFYMIEDKKFTCVHPMILVCKQIRREFLGQLERGVLGEDQSQPPQYITQYVFKIQNLNFEKVMAILEVHPEIYLNPNIQPPLPRIQVKICHDMTTATPDTTSLKKWTGFVAHSMMNLGNVDHRVVAAPAPDNREDLIRNISKLKELVCSKQKKFPNMTARMEAEAENVEAGFKTWWDMGAGKYKWVSKAEMKSIKVDKEAKKAWTQAADAFKKIGINQHPYVGSDDGNDWEVDEGGE